MAVCGIHDRIRRYLGDVSVEQLDARGFGD
jgi:hypothetical protein